MAIKTMFLSWMEATCEIASLVSQHSISLLFLFTFLFYIENGFILFMFCLIYFVLYHSLTDIIDIVKDQLYGADYIKEEDPTLYVSEKTNRGPLSEGWLQEYWNEVSTKKMKRIFLYFCSPIECVMANFIDYGIVYNNFFFFIEIVFCSI